MKRGWLGWIATWLSLLALAWCLGVGWFVWMNPVGYQTVERWSDFTGMTTTREQSAVSGTLF